MSSPGTPRAASQPRAHAGSFWAENVVFLPAADGSARILHLDGDFHAVSPLGVRMIELAIARGTAAAADAIAAEYELPPRVVRRDLEALLAQLQKARLVRTGSRHAGRQRIKSALSVLLLRPLLAAVRTAPLSLKTKAKILLALAQFSYGLFGWARTIAAWKSTFPRPGSAVGGTGEPLVASVDEAVGSAVACHVLRVQCKERSLSAWTLLAWGGAPATLVVGVDFYPFAGHCWCAWGERIVGDDPDFCALFHPVVTYGADLAPWKQTGGHTCLVKTTS